MSRTPELIYGRTSPRPKPPKTPNFHLPELDRLRTTLCEKERTIIHLKTEMTVLKQLERRRQRDFEHLQHEDEETPRVLKNLRDEVMGLRVRARM